jgi:anti-sigma B factor antagonist
MPRLEQSGDVTIIAPVGDINHREMAEVKNVVSRLLREGSRHVVLDLEGVDHINYMALGVLVERRARLKACGGDLRLAVVSTYLTDILRFAGVHEHFEAYPSVDDAVASYREELDVSISAGLRGSWVPRMH